MKVTTRPVADGDADVGAEVDAAAMRMLALREHSRLELERKLHRRGYPADAVETVLDDLQSRDLLSERRFVEGYLAQRIRKGYGPARLRAELAERGIDAGTVQRALDLLAPDWESLMLEAAFRKFGDGDPGGFSEAARRGRYLQQRGFPVGLVRRYLGGFDHA